MSHPTDLELAEFIDGTLNDQDAAVVSQHLDVCVECHALVVDAGPANWTERVPAEIPMFTEVGIKDGFAAVPRNPEPGDLWHLQWEADAILAIVLGVDRAHVSVAPILTDPLLYDDGIVPISASDSPLDVDAVAWAALITSVPIGVLNSCFGPVNSAVVDEIRQVAGGHVDSASTWESNDDGAAERTRVGALLSKLAVAHWTEPRIEEPVDVRKRAQELRISVAALAEVLDFSSSEVTELFRGQRALSQSGLASLAEILQVDSARLGQALVIPEDMALSIERPEWRPRLRNRARRQGISEATARRQLAEELLPMAARTTGSERRHLDWSHLIRDVLSDDG